MKDVWLDEHKSRRGRDLSSKRYVYIWADGIYLQARLEDDAQCILVIIGATPEGKKELIGFTTGNYPPPAGMSKKPLSLDLRERVVAAVSGGMSRRQAAERFGVSAASSIRWCQRQKETGSPASYKRGGDRWSARINAHKSLILVSIRRRPQGPSGATTRPAPARRCCLLASSTAAIRRADAPDARRCARGHRRARPADRRRSSSR